MKRGSSHSKKYQLLGFLVLLCMACQSNSPGHKSVAPQGLGRVISLEDNPFGGSEPNPPSGFSLDAKQTDLHWALAHCNCAPRVTAAFLKEIAQSRGTLPQPLVPTIREQIRNNSKLKILNILPDGLSDLVTDFFVNDDKIATEIRTGVAEKIANFAPGAPRLAERVPFRFDAFPKLGEREDLPAEFRLEDQLARWLLAFGNDSLWESKSGLGGD